MRFLTFSVQLRSVAFAANKIRDLDPASDQVSRLGPGFLRKLRRKSWGQIRVFDFLVNYEGKILAWIWAFDFLVNYEGKVGVRLRFSISS